jgi:hypothetical protein
MNRGTFNLSGSASLGAVINNGSFTSTGSLNETGNFNNNNSVTISGPQNWSAGNTFFNNGGYADFASDAGSASASPLTLNLNSGSGTEFEATQHLAAITFSGFASAVMDSVASALTPNVLNVGTLALGNGNPGQLDLTNNEMLAGATLAAIQYDLYYGYLYSSWGALGYIDVGGGVTEVRYTVFGDTNLDGQVNVADLGNLATNFNKTGGFWINGDFDYNGDVNVADLGDLATNFGQSLSSIGAGAADSAAATVPAMSSVGGSGVSVPEPSIGLLTALGVVSLHSRRRRRHCPRTPLYVTDR